MFSEDATLSDLQTNAVLAQGVAAIRSHYDRFFETPVQCLLLGRLSIGNVVVDRQLLTGLAAGAEAHCLAVYHVGPDDRIIRAQFISTQSESCRPGAPGTMNQPQSAAPATAEEETVAAAAGPNPAADHSSPPMGTAAEVARLQLELARVNAELKAADASGSGDAHREELIQALLCFVPSDSALQVPAAALSSGQPRQQQPLPLPSGQMCRREFTRLVTARREGMLQLEEVVGAKRRALAEMSAAQASMAALGQACRQDLQRSRALLGEIDIARQQICGMRVELHGLLSQFTPVDAEAVYARLAALLEERIRVLEALRSAQAAL